MSLLILVLTSASALAGEDAFWSQFHGPNRNNISTETGLLRSWPINGPTLLWTARGIGLGYSSVSLAHGLIFTAGNIGDSTVVTALDLDGSIEWQYENGGHDFISFGHGGGFYHWSVKVGRPDFVPSDPSQYDKIADGIWGYYGD